MKIKLTKSKRSSLTSCYKERTVDTLPLSFLNLNIKWMLLPNPEVDVFWVGSDRTAVQARNGLMKNNEWVANPQNPGGLQEWVEFLSSLFHRAKNSAGSMTDSIAQYNHSMLGVSWATGCLLMVLHVPEWQHGDCATLHDARQGLPVLYLLYSLPAIKQLVGLQRGARHLHSLANHVPGSSSWLRETQNNKMNIEYETWTRFHKWT